MPVRVIFNGFYRSGSTAIFELMRRTIYKRNKNAIVLYEPFHPELSEILRRWQVGKRDVLHGLNLWDDYFKLGEKELRNIRKLHPRSYPIKSLDDIAEYMDYLDSLPYDIYLQPNRLHYVLGEISLRYDCSVLHVYRNPLLTWHDYLPPHIANSGKLIREVSFTKEFTEYTGRAFFLPIDYQYVSQRYNKDIANNVFEKFCVVWLITNYIACSNADCSIEFSKLILNPKRTVIEINTFANEIIIDETELEFLRFDKAIFPMPEKNLFKKTFIDVLNRMNNWRVREWAKKALRHII